MEKKDTVHMFWLLVQVSTINDKKDFEAVNTALKAARFTPDEIKVVWNMIASIMILVSP